MKQGGTALVAALAFTFALGAFGFAYLRFGAYEAEAVEGRLRDLRAFWMAEEAISQAMAEAQAVSDPLHLPDRETRADHGYYARYWIEKVTGPLADAYRIRALAYGPGDPARPLDSLSAVIQAKSASSYFFLEDHPELTGAANPALAYAYYYTGDTIDGPVHTNSRFAIAGSPVFKGGLLESHFAGPLNGFIGNGADPAKPVVVGGQPTWNARRYPFDHFSDAIRALPPAERIRPGPGQVAQITFAGPRYLLRYVDASTRSGSQPVSLPLPADHGLFVEGDAEVRGTLDGAVTVGAAGNIAITGDLVYAGADPATGEPPPGSASFLGLIAEKNVQVRQLQPASSPGQGIRIDAAILAMDKSFQVANYKLYNRPMGPMHLWGNIVQLERGVIGAVTKSGTRLGYVKDWHYDPRLAGAPPPYFPPLRDENGRLEFRVRFWREGGGHV